MKTHLDLFSGIGGFALAASWAGFQTIGFCENEDFPRRLLSRRFPGVPIHGDIRELDGSVYRGVNLITGGFPCQPFSVSGKQAGKADDRYLWPEMLRVIAQAQPDWVVAENVTGIVSMELDQVLADLEGKATPAGRLYFQLAPSMPRTEGIESGLLPTPRASIYKNRKWWTRKRSFQNLEELAMRPGYEWLNGKPINLQWLEWHMGYPTGWTELED